MFRECFKKRPNYGHAVIILITIVKLISVIIMYGTGILEYLFTRKVLDWDLQQYTVYSSVGTTISFFGGFLGIILVQKVLRFGDITFSIVATLTAAGEYVIKISPKTSLNMYISCVVSMFKGLLGPLTRSHMRKTLPLEDIGKFFAFLGTVESLGPIIAPIIYNSLYAFTIGTVPGAIYILSAALAVFSAILLCIVQYFFWSSQSLPEYERLEGEEVEDEEFEKEQVEEHPVAKH